MSSSLLSLRDPAGRLTGTNGRLIRYVHPLGEQNAYACLHSATVARLQAEGSFIRTWEVPRSHWPPLTHPVPVVNVLEHDRIAFPSYPVEWTPAMLHAAGALTIRLAAALLDEKRGLKDATPLNVLFRGSQPVFVDALSVEPRDASSPIWRAYGQFVRTFILPLVASRHLGWTLRRTFTGARDGLTPEEFYAALPWSKRFRKSIIGTVTGPVWLERWGQRVDLPRREPRTHEERARFILQSLFRRLQHTLDDVAVASKNSAWTSYRHPSVHQPEYDANRSRIVEAILRSSRPATVLDIGTNDGFFALLAGDLGADVVAIDRDEAVVDKLYRSNRLGSKRVLPLVVDLADPTPGAGWRNQERVSFLDRAAAGFDVVLCLAVLHHLVIGDGLPLRAAVELLARLARRVVVAEFVPETDPLCQRLAAGRAIDPSRWSIDAFEYELARCFSIVARYPAGTGGRILFELIPKTT